MLKYPEIDRLLMRLDGPGDCILSSDCYPSDKIALDDFVRLQVHVDLMQYGGADLAVNFQFLHSCHDAPKLVGSP